MKKVLSTVMSVLLVGTLFIQQVFLVSAANAQIEVEVDGTKTYFDTIQSAVDSVQNGETAEPTQKRSLSIMAMGPSTSTAISPCAVHRSETMR